MADFERNMQLSLLRQEEADSIRSVTEALRRMKIGDAAAAVAGKRQAVVRRAEEVVVDRVKLPKSISVRANRFIKGAKGGGDWPAAAGRIRVLGRVRSVIQVGASSNTQKVYVHAKERDTPVELKVYNQGSTKTELCNKWKKNHCPHGNHCKFAHGLKELRPVLRHPLYKTKVCRMILNGDLCPYGHRCTFRHSLKDKEENVVTKKLSLIFQLV